MKWRYRKKSGGAASSAGRGVATSIFTVLLGVSLACVGGYFVYAGFVSSSVSRFIIGAIFVLYGGYAIAYVLKLVGK